MSKYARIVSGNRHNPYGAYADPSLGRAYGRSTPQTAVIPGREADMAPNNGGGVSFIVDEWTRLERFLILGSEGGHFQVSEAKLTKENAGCVLACAAIDAQRTVNMIVEISTSGRAPKNAPAVFALALLAGAKGQAAVFALKELATVCRTFTDLADFLNTVTLYRGWGRGLRRAVAEWYNGKKPDAVAYQMTKYRQRNGWTHRDALRVSHPVAATDEHNRLFDWACGTQIMGLHHPGTTLALPYALEAVSRAETERQVVRLIEEYGLVREHIPTDWLNSPAVWEALLFNMPMTAMIRNLGKMTSLGMFKPLSTNALVVRDRLTNDDLLEKAKVHPFGLLLAKTTYDSGHGVKGSLTWSPNQMISDALEDAFYQSFKAIRPTGKRHMLAIDVSGSMGWDSSKINETEITARVGAACMAMATVRAERNSHVMAFSDTMMDLGISRHMRLAEVVKVCEDAPMGGTNCAAAIQFALENRIEVDTFVVYTDNDTNNAGAGHPSQTLRRYRDVMGIPAKLATVAMASSGFTIADPKDAGMMDFAGFDASAPAILAEFSGYENAKRETYRRLYR